MTVRSTGMIGSRAKRRGLLVLDFMKISPSICTAPYLFRARRHWRRGPSAHIIGSISRLEATPSTRGSDEATSRSRLTQEDLNGVRVGACGFPRRSQSEDAALKRTVTKHFARLDACGWEE